MRMNSQILVNPVVAHALPVPEPQRIAQRNASLMATLWTPAWQRQMELREKLMLFLDDPAWAAALGAADNLLRDRSRGVLDGIGQLLGGKSRLVF